MKKFLLLFLIFVFTSVLYAKEDVVFYNDSLDNVYKRIMENISQYYSYYPIDTLKNNTIVMDWNKIYDINNDNPQREKFKIKLSEENNQTKVEIDYKYECYSRKGWNEPSKENMNLCFNNFVNMLATKNVNKIKLREYKNFDENKKEEIKNVKNETQIKSDKKNIDKDLVKEQNEKTQKNNDKKLEKESLDNKNKKTEKKVSTTTNKNNSSTNKENDFNVSKMSLTEVQKAQLKKYSGISYDKLYSTMLKNLKAEYKKIKFADKNKGIIETFWIYPKGKDKLTATKRIKVFVKFKTKSKTTTVVTIKVEKNNNSVWEKVTLSDKQQISMYTNLYNKLETNLK